MSAIAHTQILTIKKMIEISIPQINLPLGVFLALVNLYPLSASVENEIKKSIPKNHPDTIRSNVFACPAVIPIPSSALGF
jgi:hypothetical protein